MYNLLVKPFVRRMNTGKASSLALAYFKMIGMIPGGRFINRLVHGNRPQGLEKEVFGLNFYNPVGLGAGLDLKGDLYDNLEDLGFSFVEIGPLDADSTRHAISNIQKNPQSDILAACIGKDFLLSFSLAYDFCDMFVIELPDASTSILDAILDCRLSYDGDKPVIAKLPESLTGQEITDIVEYCRYNGVDGIETRSYSQTSQVAMLSKGRLPIIANCHIKTPGEAAKALSLGAELIVVRSGLVTQGPRLVASILRYLSAKNSNNEQNKR